MAELPVATFREDVGFFENGKRDTSFLLANTLYARKVILDCACMYFTVCELRFPSKHLMNAR